MKGLFMCCLLLICLGCEEIFFEPDTGKDPVANFDYVWNAFSERYSLFEYKNIDWDSVYSVYRPRVSDSSTDEELYDVLSDMLNSLRDGHTNLRTPFDISRYFPYLEAAPNFNYDLVERNYLGTDFRFTGFLLNQVIDDVGYIYYRSFTQPINDWELDTVIHRFERANVKGVIIDIRNNEGGNPANGLKMLGRLIEMRTHIYSSQQKSGVGPNDFGPVQQIFLDPETDHPHFPGKVFVLTNRKVYSAGSYFSAGVFAIDGVQLVGDTTGGGSGVPAGFDLPNGWACNYSSTIGTLVNGVNFEGGVPPDVYLTMDPTDEANGVDTIIEFALEEIRK